MHMHLSPGTPSPVLYGGKLKRGERSVNVIMPVVGEGRRFREAGHTVLKPFINIRGRMMIEWALDPIPEDWNVYVICKEADREVFVNRLAMIKRNMKLMNLLGPTQGAACTVLAAAVGLPPDEPVAVVNCDQWFGGTGAYGAELMMLQEQALNGNWDGYILTFKGEGTRWSYVKTAEDGFVRQTAEKVRISDQATVGFYWFREAGDLVRGICDMISSNIKTRGEFYLCPVYNELVWRYRHKVKALAVDEFWGLGTPEDVQRFEKDFPYPRTSSTEIGLNDQVTHERIVS